MRNEEMGRCGETAAHARRTMEEKLKKVVDTLPKMSRQEISSDVMGSYTGTPSDGGRPVQDADDL